MDTRSIRPETVLHLSPCRRLSGQDESRRGDGCWAPVVQKPEVSKALMTWVLRRAAHRIEPMTFFATRELRGHARALIPWGPNDCLANAMAAAHQSDGRLVIVGHWGPRLPSGPYRAIRRDPDLPMTRIPDAGLLPRARTPNPSESHYYPSRTKSPPEVARERDQRSTEPARLERCESCLHWQEHRRPTVSTSWNSLSG